MQFHIPACCVIKLAFWNQSLYIFFTFMPICFRENCFFFFFLTDLYCKTIDVNSAVLYEVLPSVEYEQSGRTPCKFLKICYCFAPTSEQLLVHVILVSRFETFIEIVLILLWTLWVSVYLCFSLFIFIFYNTSPVHPGRSEVNQSSNTHIVEENCLWRHLQYMYHFCCWFTAKTLLCNRLMTIKIKIVIFMLTDFLITASV